MWGEKFVVLFVPVSFYAKPSYLIKWLKAYKTSFQPLREYENLKIGEIASQLSLQRFIEFGYLGAHFSSMKKSL